MNVILPKSNSPQWIRDTAMKQRLDKLRRRMQEPSCKRREKPNQRYHIDKKSVCCLEGSYDRNLVAKVGVSFCMWLFVTVSFGPEMTANSESTVQWLSAVLFPTDSLLSTPRSAKSAHGHQDRKRAGRELECGRHLRCFAGCKRPAKQFQPRSLLLQWGERLTLPGMPKAHYSPPIARATNAV